ncbi:hypothetical protein LQG66_03775 [Bradyrhizobium ontarionense]|uniref:Uncharacterized protein n=1 Tax=Bradyrhizobium ontarionense TaxID=2898149 RepID=A0ABY3REQ2_9BRAD|nr:hypothetical protein [Bradyrhizobium sp. A19]UFZ05445.1 hypothetical protein LQG66_03775 [Bradyrhizobium sp. A19]
MSNRASSFPATPQIPPLHRYGGVLASTPELAIHALGDAYWVEGTGTVRGLPGWPKGPPIHLYLVGRPTFLSSSKLLMPGGQNYTFSPGDSCWALPLGDGAWRVISIDVAALSPVAGWRNKQSAAKTATYPVVANDAGSTLSLGTNTFFELTFGPASSYPSDFAVMVRNTDSYSGIGTGRGRRINLNGTKSILYPGQNVQVFSADDGSGPVWDWTPKKQRWVQGTVFACVDSGGGALGTVDGLATGAGAFSQLQDAASFIWYGVDQAGSSATIYPTAGQTFVQSLSLGGQPVGSNVVYLKGNGGQATMLGSNGTDLVSVGDNAELIIQDMYLQSQNNTFGKAVLKMHGNGLIDTFSGVTIQGGGANDVGVYLDNGACIFAIFNILTFTNTFKNIIRTDRGGQISLGPGMQPTGALAITNFMELYGPGFTTAGTAITGNAAAWGTPGNIIVDDGHTFKYNAAALPAGLTVSSARGAYAY